MADTPENDDDGSAENGTENGTVTRAVMAHAGPVIDISEEMLAIAADKDLYRQTFLADLTQPLTLADGIYAAGGHAWALQSSPLVQGVIHEGGRQASKWAWYAVAVCLLVALAHRPLWSWRMPLAYLLLSTLLSTALVAAMKRGTHMDCPWDLLRYGGEKAYYGLFARRPVGMGSAGCFPAGHASAGYAWVALYFFFLATRPQWRWWGLACALVAGLVFGIAQQLRGAHFLSHDLWALMLCWLVALSLHRLMLVPRLRAVQWSATA